jgi:hypothetical protein
MVEHSHQQLRRWFRSSLCSSLLVLLAGMRWLSFFTAAVCSQHTCPMLLVGAPHIILKLVQVDAEDISKRVHWKVGVLAAQLSEQRRLCSRCIYVRAAQPQQQSQTYLHAECASIVHDL